MEVESDQTKESLPSEVSSEPNLQKSSMPKWARFTLETALLLGAGYYYGSENTISITGASGEPNYPPGSKAFMDPLSLGTKDRERFELVIFKDPCPDLDSTTFIKRVIALGGETIEYKHGSLYIDGTQKQEPQDMVCSTEDFGPIDVPLDHVFVMGDHRDNSFDSRDFGTVPISKLKTAYLIYRGSNPTENHTTRCLSRDHNEQELEAKSELASSFVKKGMPDNEVMAQGSWQQNIGVLLEIYPKFNERFEYKPAGLDELLLERLPDIIETAEDHAKRFPDCYHRKLVEEAKALQEELKSRQ